MNWLATISWSTVALIVELLLAVGVIGLLARFGMKLSAGPIDETAELKLGFAIGGLALAGDFFCAWFISSERSDGVFHYLLLILGGTLGWLTGILLSPGQDEKRQFNDWGSAIVAFVSGALACKFADPLEKIILEGRLTRMLMSEALVCIDSFLICMAMVFVARKYAKSRIPLASTDSAGSGSAPTSEPKPLVRVTAPELIPENKN